MNAAPPWLAQAAREVPVLVVHSNLSDLRSLRRRLDAQGVVYRELTLDMGVAEDRERFHALRAHTGWSTLPQVFVNGRFAGGAEELPAAAGMRSLSGRGAGLALLAVVPLAAAGLWLAFADPRWHAWVLQALVHYLALGLAFAGALQWRAAAAVAGLRFRAQVLLCAGPALYAWLVLMLPVLAEAALLLLAVGYIALYVGRRAWLAPRSLPP